MQQFKVKAVSKQINKSVGMTSSMLETQFRNLELGSDFEVFLLIYNPSSSNNTFKANLKVVLIDKVPFIKVNHPKLGGSVMLFKYHAYVSYDSFVNRILNEVYNKTNKIVTGVEIRRNGSEVYSCKLALK